MHFARVENGRVAEIAQLPATFNELVLDADGRPLLDAAGAFQYRARALRIEDVFSPEVARQFTEVGDDVGPGWTFDGFAFSPPPIAGAPTIDEERIRRQAEVNAKRDAIVAGGYRHPFGGTVGTRILDQRSVEDDVAWQRVAKTAQDLTSEGDRDHPMMIRDANNSTFEAKAMAVDAAMSALGLWRSAIAEHSWALKDAIKAATTQAELDTIDIDAGWPG